MSVSEEQKNANSSAVSRCLSRTKRLSPSISKGPRKINNQSVLFPGVSLKHKPVVLKKFGSKGCSTGYIQ